MSPEGTHLISPEERHFRDGRAARTEYSEQDWRSKCPRGWATFS